MRNADILETWGSQECQQGICRTAQEKDKLTVAVCCESVTFCEDFLSLPVEEWGAKLGQGRKLFLWVHDKGMAWNYCTWGALVYDDEPKGAEDNHGELRDDNENPVFKKDKKSATKVLVCCRLWSNSHIWKVLMDDLIFSSAIGAKCWPGGWDNESWRISLCCTAL